MEPSDDRGTLYSSTVDGCPIVDLISQPPAYTYITYTHILPDEWLSLVSGSVQEFVSQEVPTSLQPVSVLLGTSGTSSSSLSVLLTPLSWLLVLASTPQAPDE